MERSEYCENSEIEILKPQNTSCYFDRKCLFFREFCPQISLSARRLSISRGGYYGCFHIKREFALFCANFYGWIGIFLNITRTLYLYVHQECQVYLCHNRTRICHMEICHQVPARAVIRMNNKNITLRVSKFHRKS